MSPLPSNRDELDSGDRSQVMSALFAHLVVTQTNMALLFLGRTPHPESGQPVRDLDAAKLFIDQLEMLEFKTKGNLSKEENHLLKQSLTTLRLAFVEEIEKGQPEPEAPAPPAAPASPAASPASSAPEPAAENATALAPAPEETKKKFTKKY